MCTGAPASEKVRGVSPPAGVDSLPTETFDEIRRKAAGDDRSVSSWFRRAAEHELQGPARWTVATPDILQVKLGCAEPQLLQRLSLLSN